MAAYNNIVIKEVNREKLRQQRNQHQKRKEKENELPLILTKSSK
jgi:hypothetical protein